jgi:hypothetical protein
MDFGLKQGSMFGNPNSKATFVGKIVKKKSDNSTAKANSFAQQDWYIHRKAG